MMSNLRCMQWLSRGLEEALLGFITSATDSSYALRCAFYELTYVPVILALKEGLNGIYRLSSFIRPVFVSV